MKKLPTSKTEEVFTGFCAGLIISQSLIVEYLHDKGLVNKKDIVDELQKQIDTCQKNNTLQNIPSMFLALNLARDVLLKGSFKDTVENFNKNTPDWFRGVINNEAYETRKQTVDPDLPE